MVQYFIFCYRTHLNLCVKSDFPFSPALKDIKLCLTFLSNLLTKSEDTKVQ